MKTGDIFELSGIFLLYMGHKAYISHKGEPLLESEVRLKGWTVYMTPIYLTSESELRRRKARCNIGRKFLLRLEKAEKGETRYCGPCFAESKTLESAALYDAQMNRLDSLWSCIKRLQWRT